MQEKECMRKNVECIDNVYISSWESHSFTI